MSGAAARQRPGHTFTLEADSNRAACKYAVKHIVSHKYFVILRLNNN